MYNEDEAEEYYINVFISHGKNPLWKETENFIKDDLGHETLTIKNQPHRETLNMYRLDEETDDCDFAIVIITADDEQSDPKPEVRQNIIHEIGFLQGKFGPENVLVLKESGMDGYTEATGIEYAEFESGNISSAFSRIREELEEALNRFIEDDIDDEEDDEDEEDY